MLLETHCYISKVIRYYLKAHKPQNSLIMGHYIIE